MHPRSPALLARRAQCSREQGYKVPPPNFFRLPAVLARQFGRAWRNRRVFPAMDFGTKPWPNFLLPPLYCPCLISSSYQRRFFPFPFFARQFGRAWRNRRVFPAMGFGTKPWPNFLLPPSSSLLPLPNFFHLPAALFPFSLFCAPIRARLAQSPGLPGDGFRHETLA